MNPEYERACLQAAVDYLSLTPRELAERPCAAFDGERMREMKQAAKRVLRDRLHEIETLPTEE